jgi:ribulose-5-phosphate 4-epimerase/fuculose-1-phosphate aldolase
MAAEAKPLINPDQIKFDLCCAARILYRAGMSAANAGHISIMIAPDRMLMNRFGLSFGTLLPHDVLTLDFRGNIVEDHTPQKNARVNETVELHGVIHRYNPELVCALHTHPPATVTFSAFRKVPEIYDQESCILAGDVAVVEEDYEGLASSEERLRSTAEAVGKHRAVILPNHGAITTGRNVQVAMFLMLLLEGMVARNLSVAAAARATGFTPIPIKMEHALAAKMGIAKMNALEPLWADQLHRLRQTDPELFA